jgi:hypothetical protein
MRLLFSLANKLMKKNLGRAETWDNDSKGIPKGEHNHQTEHDLAELEYFKVIYTFKLHI